MAVGTATLGPTASPPASGHLFPLFADGLDRLGLRLPLPGLALSELQQKVVEHRKHHQGQEGREGEAEDHRDAHPLPPLTALSSTGEVQLGEIELDIVLYYRDEGMARQVGEVIAAMERSS